MAVLRNTTGAGACALAIAVLVLGSAGRATAGVRIGETLPDVTLSGWDGRPTALRDLRAPVIVIDFWASWCPPCREALPRLSTLQRQLAAEGLRVVAINIDRRPEAADRFVVEQVGETSMLLLHDPEAVALARFGAQGMPSLYVLDGAGVVRLIASGYAPAELNRIEGTIRELLTRERHP